MLAAYTGANVVLGLNIGADGNPVLTGLLLLLAACLFVTVLGTSSGKPKP